jgi:hypothetical protein
MAAPEFHAPLLRALPRGRAPSSPDDEVTAKRRELKFVFPGHAVAGLRDILSVNARPIRFGSGDFSAVNSIYFDDHRLSSCAESLAGVSRRVKLRLRWYDRDFSAGRLFFETKRRSGQTTSKERTALEALVPLDRIRYADLVPQIAAALDERAEALLAMRPNPTAIVSYRREHFRYAGTSIRITLDYDIEAFMQEGCERPRRDCRVSLDGLAVVEVKTSEADLPEVRAALHPLTPRLVRCSKYVQCCLADPFCAVLLRD